MITFETNEQNVIQLGTTDNGLTTFKTVTGTQAVSQNVLARLLILRQGKEYEPESAIDWIALFNDSRLIPVVGTLIQALIADTDEVESVDLSKAEFQLNPPQFKGLCFMHECNPVELSL